MGTLASGISTFGMLSVAGRKFLAKESASTTACAGELVRRGQGEGVRTRGERVAAMAAVAAVVAPSEGKATKGSHLQHVLRLQVVVGLLGSHAERASAAAAAPSSGQGHGPWCLGPLARGVSPTVVTPRRTLRSRGVAAAARAEAMGANGELELQFRSKVRLGDTAGVKGMLKHGEVDIMAPGMTKRKWTALHIACWGTAKPQNDKDIVEAILIAASKAGKEAALRGIEDASPERLKAIDLAKERRDGLVGGGAGGESADSLDEKRKFDKIIEWLEKGMPAPGS